MADRVRKVNYVYMKVPNRAGHGAKILTELREEGVGLLAYTGFPDKGGKAQIDLVPENMPALRRVAKKNGWRLSKPKKGFLITGRDDLGAVQRHINKLADSKINITAAKPQMAVTDEGHVLPVRGNLGTARRRCPRGRKHDRELA